MYLNIYKYPKYTWLYSFDWEKNIFVKTTAMFLILSGLCIVYFKYGDRFI